MKIRPMKKGDIAQAVAIVGKNYNNQYNESVERELKDMFGKASVKPYYYVAEHKGTIIGFGGFIQSWMDYSIYQIFWINVLPERQGQGIGIKLTSKIISEIKKNKDANIIQLTADIRIKNDRYYKKHFGFKTLQLFHNKTYALMSLALEK